MGKFQESVKALKRERFRELAKQQYSWPDQDTDTLFDNVIKAIDNKRSVDYVGKLKERYGEDLLSRVFEWARTNLSPLEMDKLKNFEEMASAYIEANPREVSMKDMELFIAKDGKIKKIVPSPEDTPIGEIDADEDGNVWEKPPAPKIKVQPKIPDIAEARRMTSDELAKIINQGE